MVELYCLGVKNALWETDVSGIGLSEICLECVRERHGLKLAWLMKLSMER